MAVSNVLGSRVLPQNGGSGRRVPADVAHVILNEYQWLFTSERHKREASQWMIFGLLLGKSSSQKPLEAIEACQHRLLRPLSSNLILDVTSEVIWRLQQGPQMPPEVSRGDIHMDIRVVEAMHFKSNIKFNL